MESLHYHGEKEDYSLPENERNLPTVTAELFLEVPTENVEKGKNILEGLCFDRQGNLYFAMTYEGKIFYVDMKKKELHLFKQLDGMNIASVKIHKNGDIYAAVVSGKEGSLVAVLSESGRIKEKIPIPDGHNIDDLVFDRKGGFYLTDLGGSISDRTAGIYYVTPDHQKLFPVIEDGMISTNGIALSADERSLWVTEYGQSLLHWFELTDDGLLPQTMRTRQPYHFTGLDGPDSITLDADHNLYVSICGQGRFLVFNPSGIPIGNILIPGREKGRMLKSTHIAICPGTRTAYMCSADMKTGKSAIYRAGVYADTLKTFQYQ